MPVIFAYINFNTLLEKFWNMFLMQILVCKCATISIIIKTFVYTTHIDAFMTKTEN